MKKEKGSGSLGKKKREQVRPFLKSKKGQSAVFKKKEKRKAVAKREENREREIEKKREKSLKVVFLIFFYMLIFL